MEFTPKEGSSEKLYLIFALEETPRMVDGIEILPWRDFLSRLWGGELG